MNPESQVVPPHPPEAEGKNMLILKLTEEERKKVLKALSGDDDSGLGTGGVAEPR
jgi:hypothetical protein